MPIRSKPSITKRNREQARRERAEEKVRRRDQRAEGRKERADLPEGEDPDLVGIVPGPQPNPYLDD
jgi:hypothetical protein